MNSLEFQKIFEKVSILHRKKEFKELFFFVEALKPKIVIEIGTYRGGSFTFWEILLPEDGLLIGIDTQNKIHSFLKKTKKNVHFIKGASQDSKTLAKLREILDGKKIDFLYINAHHTYKGAKQDFETYVQFCKPNGIVAFHDIRAPNDARHKNYGVGKFFKELKEKGYKTKEILEPLGRHKGSDGIGIIYLGEKKK